MFLCRIISCIAFSTFCDAAWHYRNAFGNFAQMTIVTWMPSPWCRKVQSILLMEEILHHLVCVKLGQIMGETTNLNRLAGFLPSTVWISVKHCGSTRVLMSLPWFATELNRSFQLMKSLGFQSTTYRNEALGDYLTLRGYVQERCYCFLCLYFVLFV